MRTERRASDHPAGAEEDGSRVRATAPVVRPPARTAVAQLPGALQILAIQLHDAVVERRTAVPGSDRYHRADERVAYLNDLYVGLQRRMEVPAEVWLLGGGRAPARDRQPREWRP